MKDQVAINKIPVIGSLRGIAALAVCLFHFVYSPKDFIDDESVTEIFNWGQKGVEVFFIISAVVIPMSLLKLDYSLRKAPLFLWKRLVRVEPPYIVAVILGIGYLVIRNYIPSSADIDLTPTVTEVVLHLGYLIPLVEGTHWINSVFWTLAIEFQFYIFLALSFPLLVHKNILFRILFHVLIFIPVLFFTDNTSFLYWSAYFAFGIYYVMWRFQKITIWEFLILFVVSAVATTWQHNYINALIAAGTLSIIHFLPQITTKVGEMLGNISYSLYLVHNIIGAAFLNFFASRVDSGIGKFAIIIAAIAISIFSAWLLWKIVEKPFHERSQRIGKSKNK
jgi:peptidoglycan/LPS O-acetylase OafA/YrhL